MNSLHLVDPTLRPVLDLMPNLTLTREALPALRARPAFFPPADPTLTTHRQQLVPGPPGAPDVTLHVFRPGGDHGALPGIYHIHGGGYVMGKVADLEPILRQLASDLSCVVVSVEYRLAPETTYPGPIEDCYAGLAWLFANAEATGVDAGRIGVMGESAGGGYAAALSLLARDRGLPALAFQCLTYPMLDDRTCTRDVHPYTGEFVWTAAHNRFGWEAMLGHEPGGPDVSAYAAPARADDLSGLPPAYIATGALDLFVDENLDYARRLIRAGVPTELHVYPGACHAFDAVPGSPLAARARADRREALGRALEARSAPQADATAG